MQDITVTIQVRSSNSLGSFYSVNQNKQKGQLLFQLKIDC